MISDFKPEPFRRAWWLPGAHLQTLGARALRSVGDIRFKRERIVLPDGDFVDLDFPYPESWNDSHVTPYVLVLHGLEGSARSKYAIETYRHLHTFGLRAVGLNFRSCSGELNRLPRLYHSGDTGDLASIVELLGQRYPNSPFGLIGFSIGGNVLLKFLGERGHNAPSQLVAATAISVPFDLAAGAAHLNRWAGRIYSSYLVRKLQRKVTAKKEMLLGKIDFERALAAKDFWTFDDAATAPLHGFAGADDYYRRSSSANFIEAIGVPTLLLHSVDDPFLPSASVPTAAAAQNDNILTNFSTAGGHVGFVSGANPLRPFFWVEYEAARFMRAVLPRE